MSGGGQAKAELGPTRPLEAVLVANRGEIAVRVIRTLRAMGLRSIAIHSDADAASPHVRAADTSVRVGPAAAAESYLRIDRVIDAALAAGADAIHPGYGFLSENPAFATACDEAGLVFVGPPAAAIRTMGDKAAAKRRMAEIGVPVLPGYEGDAQSDERLLAEAERVGLPLMVKPAAGGGGKGMRLVTTRDELVDALASARREAAGAFGDDALILERALLNPRHVEIQVLADGHGAIVSLGERDCSVQRRHQKIIEEAPCPVVDEALREEMGQAAIRAARAVDYVGAGTVEYLLETDADGEPGFWFLEMNTRLQVEHPVTELVTGIDLVEWQLRVARGESLEAMPPVRLDGHAIEARVYAEDPAHDFLPASGTVEAFAVPDGVRVDAGIEAGNVVGAHYDPLLAKVVAHGPDRDTARRRLRAALADTTVLGVRTNRGFLVDVLDDPVFADGRATTGFLGSWRPTGPVGTTEVAIAAALLHRARHDTADRRSPRLAGWTSSGPAAVTMSVEVDREVHDVVVTPESDHLVVDIADERHDVRFAGDGIQIDGQHHRAATVRRSADEILLRVGRHDLVVTDVLLRRVDAATAIRGSLTAPMHGTVTDVLVVPGDTVARGDRIAVVEAMKMEHAVTTDVSGIVAEVHVEAGDQVAADDLLARVERETADEQDA